jgi:hypothetical protein
MFDHLLLKIDELDRVCQLSASQQTRLRIAAKGAVDRAIVKWLDATSTNTAQNAAAIAAQPSGQNIFPDAVGRQEVGVFLNAQPMDGAIFLNEGVALNQLIIAEGQPAAQNVVIRVLNDGPQPVQAPVVAQGLDTTAVEHEPIWTSAEQKVLTPQQLQARQAAIAARNGLSRKTPAEQVLAELDRRLMLDASQREPFAKLMRPLIEARVKPAANGRRPSIASTTTMLLRARPAPEMSKILSERQLNLWRSTKRPAAQPAQVVNPPAIRF